MKKVLFTTLSIIAAAAMMMVSCKKDDPKDNGKDNNGEQQEQKVDDELVGTWTITGEAQGWAADGGVAMTESKNVWTAAEVAVKGEGFKFVKDGAWTINLGASPKTGSTQKFDDDVEFDLEKDGDNIAGAKDGIYSVTLNLLTKKAKIKFVKDIEAQPAGREGKAFKLTAETSENALFEKSEYVDLAAGATFQVKFYANKWKTGDCDRLCCFESKTESPSMLVRFSNDGTQPGQLRFNNNQWRIGGGDGVKLTDSEGNPYIYEKQKWHVLTMVLTPGEEGKVTVAFYDNENKINEAEGNINSKNNQGVAIPQFYFQRFEFGMSWEYNYNNDEYSLWQLFDGYIDYARVWSRPLSDSEIAEGLCDIDPETAEGLLAYWIMDDGKDNGIIPNRAADKDYNIDFSKMSEMDGGTVRKTLDLKDSFMNALEETDTPLCEF